ncbi:hypothetical protein MKZ38_010468 [Zalerion maritima]|uniref:Uncharacterized protein n=1 Tax=Zalerion maritima TaxID=339359 RepID=A0AAD5RTW0_9PEZI|nr:hypothetical protein MKZ38_010468 [Zalerion maritima]
MTGPPPGHGDAQGGKRKKAEKTQRQGGGDKGSSSPEGGGGSQGPKKQRAEEDQERLRYDTVKVAAAQEEMYDAAKGKFGPKKPPGAQNPTPGAMAQTARQVDARHRENLLGPQQVGQESYITGPPGSALKSQQPQLGTGPSGPSGGPQPFPKGPYEGTAMGGIVLPLPDDAQGLLPAGIDYAIPYHQMVGKESRPNYIFDPAPPGWRDLDPKALGLHRDTIVPSKAGLRLYSPEHYQQAFGQASRYSVPDDYRFTAQRVESAINAFGLEDCYKSKQRSFFSLTKLLESRSAEPGIDWRTLQTLRQVTFVDGQTPPKGVTSDPTQAAGIPLLAPCELCAYYRGRYMECLIGPSQVAEGRLSSGNIQPPSNCPCVECSHRRIGKATLEGSSLADLEAWSKELVTCYARTLYGLHYSRFGKDELLKLYGWQADIVRDMASRIEAVRVKGRGMENIMMEAYRAQETLPGKWGITMIAARAKEICGEERFRKEAASRRAANAAQKAEATSLLERTKDEKRKLEVDQLRLLRMNEGRGCAFLMAIAVLLRGKFHFTHDLVEADHRPRRGDYGPQPQPPPPPPGGFWKPPESAQPPPGPDASGGSHQGYGVGGSSGQQRGNSGQTSDEGKDGNYSLSGQADDYNAGGGQSTRSGADEPRGSKAIEEITDAISKLSMK